MRHHVPRRGARPARAGAGEPTPPRGCGLLACERDVGSGAPGVADRRRRDGALRGDGAPRPGRHGPRLQGPPPGLERRPRGEDAAARGGARARRARGLRARGGDVGRPRAPPPRRLLLLREARGRRPPRLHRVRGRREPPRRHPRPATGHGGVDARRRDPERVGAALRARARSRPPRRQAREPPAHRGRRRQGHRLRPRRRSARGRRAERRRGEPGALRNGRRLHRDARKRRHARLHVARADGGLAAHAANGPLELGPLRARDVQRRPHLARGPRGPGRAQRVPRRAGRARRSRPHAGRARRPPRALLRR
jgi:hypothetical protein